VQAAATPADVLYITGAQEQAFAGLGECRLSVAPPGDSDGWPGSEAVDCLLVDTVGASEGATELVERVRRVYPATPLVAFVGDGVPVAAVLDAGATDVVPSSPAETPEALVQRRVENVCERDGGEVPGVSDHGSYTDEDLLEHLSEHLGDVIWVNNPYNPPGSEIEFVSAAYEEVWGRPREHLLTGGTEAFYETIHPDDRERVRESTVKARLESGRVGLTYRIVRPDGEIRLVHDRALGIDDDGEMRPTVGIARDITERSERERELEGLEEMLESVLSNVPMVFFAFDDEGVFTRSQGRALRNIGFEPGEAVGQSVFDVYADRPDIRRHCERALDGEQVTATVDIGDRTFESWYQPLYDDGDVVEVVGHSYDITDQVTQKQRLERQNDLFTKAQDIADVGAWEYSLDGPNLWTEKVYDIFEIPADTTPTTETVQAYYHDDDWPRVRAALDRAVNEREPFDLEVRVVTGNDNLRWVHLRGEPQEVDGEVVRVRGTMQDITERKQRERELERNKTFLEQIQQVGDVGGWEYDFRTENLRVTDRTCEVLGLPSGTELSLEELVANYHPEDRDTVAAAARGVTEGESFENEVRVVPEDGEPRWVYTQGEPVYEDGEVVAMRGVSRDIDDRKRREQRIQAERDLVERIIETSPVGIAIHDADGEILSVNERIAEMVGIEQEALESRGKSPDGMRVISGDVTWSPGEELLVEYVARTGEAVRDEECLVELPSGEQVVLVVDGVPLFEDGDLERIIVTLEDVTDRVERKEQLRAERDLIERILGTSPFGIAVHDAEGYITRANEQAAEILGLGTDSLERSEPEPEGITVLTQDGDPVPERDIPVEQVRATGEPVRDEQLVVERPDGERVEIVVDAVPLFDDDGLQRVVVTFDDVTRLARLDRINRIIRNLDTALVGANTREEVEQAVCDQLSESGRYEHTLVFRASDDELAVQATCEDHDPAAVLGGEIPDTAPTRRAVETGEIQHSQDGEWTVCGAVGDGDPNSLAAIPLAYEDQVHGALVVCANSADALDGGELEVLDELGRTVGHAIAAVESREREARLTSLYEATQDLLAAESPQEVSEVVVETAGSVLDPPGVGVFLFDDEENVLELADGTDRLREFYSESTEFGPGREDSITWQSYIRGEERFVPDVHESDHLANTETDARSSLFLPLGEHGVIVVSTDERLSFDEQKRNLMGLLAATTEAALDRVVGQAGIREREHRLEERETRLTRLEGVFSLIGDIDTALQESGTREEFERTVCERLVDTHPYEFAWVGAIPPDGRALEPRAWADGETTGQAYLDAVSLALDGETPAARAGRTGDLVRVSNVTDHLHEADWARTAVEHGYQSVLAVPLAHEDATHGVLTVHASEPNAFGGLVREMFDRLGALVPRVGTRLQRDRTVLADRVVELELSLPDPESFPNAVAAAVGHPVQYQQATPTSDGRTRIMFALSDAPVERIRDIEERFVTVESLDVVERAGEVVFRATLSGSTVATTLLSCGAIPREVVAHPDSATATVRLPHDADVRLFLDRVDEHYPGVELASRRDIEARGAAEAAVRRALAEDLTDRQREVLRTAYENGFFESPRGTTGIELADRLGVSQPTVTHHLREAQRRLFVALFE
jgi:PAS domain S-box-containing protein